MHLCRRQYISFFLILCGFVLTTAAMASPDVQSHDSADYFFHQSFNNLDEEIDIAQEEGKKGLFIMFNDKDCPWCAKMKNTIMNQKSVQEYYRQHFRVLTIDARGNNLITNFDGKEIAEKDFAFKGHRVRATPVFIFFDLSGKPIMRYTGATRDVEEFQWLGEFITSGAYKTKKFTKYKREKRKKLVDRGK